MADADAEPLMFDVWSEHLDGPDEITGVRAFTARGAVVMKIAQMADDGVLLPVEQGEITIEDFLARGPDRRTSRFRCLRDDEDALTIQKLRACRVCGCTDDRACDPPCSWVEDDLCTTPQCLESAAHG